MKTHTRTWISVLAAVALGASLASLYVHYRMIADPNYTSFCDISETVSCEAVYQSAYGSVAGVPVAAGGAIWSALVLLLAFFGLRSPKSDTSAAVGGYLFVLSTIGLAAVLYFGYASFFVLNKMCVLCMTVYVTVIGIFVLSGASSQVALTSLPGRIGRDVGALLKSPTAAAVAAVWVIASASLVAFFPRADAAPAAVVEAAPAAPTETLSADELAQFDQWLVAQPRTELPVPKDGALVLIAKFNDYQCPACRQTYLEYKWIADKWRASNPDLVKFATVDFPLESECNSGGVHGYACEAAAAVRMAKAKGRGEAMEDWLFQNQTASMSVAGVKDGLADIAQVTDFDAQYPKVLEQVRADAQLGQRLGITGTPTFYINGIKINTSLRPTYFDAAIALELKRAQAATP